MYISSILLILVPGLFDATSASFSFYVPPSPHSALDTHLHSITVDVASYTTSFENQMIYLHNALRSEHNSSMLRWNSTLRNAAQAHADDCHFTPSNRAWGENLAAGFSNATAAVRAWINERKDYHKALEPKTGHFTQMVWNDTQTLGCGASLCDDIARSGERGWLLVCTYWPRGNVNAGVDLVMANIGERVRNLGVDGTNAGPLKMSEGSHGKLMGSWILFWMVCGWVLSIFLCSWCIR